MLILSLILQTPTSPTLVPTLHLGRMDSGWAGGVRASGPGCLGRCLPWTALGKEHIVIGPLIWRPWRRPRQGGQSLYSQPLPDKSPPSLGSLFISHAFCQVWSSGSCRGQGPAPPCQPLPMSYPALCPSDVPLLPLGSDHTAPEDTPERLAVEKLSKVSFCM